MESVILTLIYIVVVVGACWLVIWVLEMIGVPLPPMVIKCFWVIVALVILLLVWRLIGPALEGGHLPGFK